MERKQAGQRARRRARKGRKVYMGRGKTRLGGVQGMWQNEECKERMPKLRCSCWQLAGACRG